MTAQKTVLLIEDDVEFQKIVGETLMKLNHTVVMAKDVVEANARIAFQKFDVIVTDIRLGKGSGLNFLVDLKLKKVGLPTIIVMTGLAVSADVREKLTMGLGVKRILEKPFAMSEFGECLKSTA